MFSPVWLACDRCWLRDGICHGMASENSGMAPSKLYHKLSTDVLLSAIFTVTLSTQGHNQLRKRKSHPYISGYECIREGGINRTCSADRAVPQQAFRLLWAEVYCHAAVLLVLFCARFWLLCSPMSVAFVTSGWSISDTSQLFRVLLYLLSSSDFESANVSVRSPITVFIFITHKMHK